MKKNRTHLVFAYGSNLYAPQMIDRCRSARYVERAWIPEVRLIFASWSTRWGGGVAGLAMEKRSRVHGVIYAVSDDDLESLDRFEGHPGVYSRVRCHLITPAGKRPAAYVYALMRGVDRRALPSIEYREAIRAGYEAWGLPKRDLDRALTRNLREYTARLQSRLESVDRLLERAKVARESCDGFDDVTLTDLAGFDIRRPA